MPKVIVSVALLLLLLCGCTSKAYVQQQQELKGKKIGIASIKVSATKKENRLPSKDTICICIGQSTGEAFQPYLQEAGFKVTNLYTKEHLDPGQAYAAADSLQIDYILFGSATVDIRGKYTFMDQLTISLVNAKTREVAISGSFNGSATSPIKAAGKIGKKIVGQMN